MPRRHIRLLLLVHADEEQQRQADGEYYSDQFEGVHVGKMVALRRYGVFQRFHRHLVRVHRSSARRGEALFDSADSGDGGGVVGREVAEHVDAVRGHALGDVGVGDGDAERAAELAHHVVQAGRLANVASVQAGDGEHRHGDEDEAEGEAPEHQNPEKVRRAGLHGLHTEFPAEPEEGDHAHRHQGFRRGTFLQGDAERHRNDAGEHGAGKEHQAGQKRREAKQALHEDRKDEERAVQPVADNEGQHGGDGQIFAPAQHREVNRRMLRVQLVPHEGDERNDGNERKQGDVGRFKPVLRLAAFEDELERADARREQADTRPVDLLDRMLHPRLLDVGQRGPGGEQADRNVHEKTPLPGEVVHQPAAEQRADGRAEHEAHRKDAGGRAALFGLEGFV